MNPHIGSSLDDFLAEEAILEETTAVAIKRVVAWQIAQEMKVQHLTKTALAQKMHTSRAALNRLLDESDRNLRGKPRGSARGSSEQAGTACGFLRCIAYDDAHREYQNPSTPYQRQARQSAVSDGA